VSFVSGHAFRRASTLRTLRRLKPLLTVRTTQRAVGPAFELADSAKKAGAPFFASFAKGGNHGPLRNPVKPQAGYIRGNLAAGAPLLTLLCVERTPSSAAFVFEVVLIQNQKAKGVRPSSVRRTSTGSPGHHRKEFDPKYLEIAADVRRRLAFLAAKHSSDYGPD
jgi:hypothetical protein